MGLAADGQEAEGLSRSRKGFWKTGKSRHIHRPGAGEHGRNDNPSQATVAVAERDDEIQTRCRDGPDDEHHRICEYLGAAHPRTSDDAEYWNPDARWHQSEGRRYRGH